MVFTKSLLIKALGGVAGVSGTTVGVLAGTGVFDRRETNTPPKADERVDSVNVGGGVGDGSHESSSGGKTDSTQKNPSDNNSIESDSVKRTTEEQDSIQGGSSVGQESIQTGSSAPENQERSTTDGGDQDRVSIEPTDNTDDQQRDGVSGGGNLPSNPVQSPGDEVQNRSTDVPGGLPSSSNVVENTLENGVSQEKQKGEGGKDSVETVNTKENVSERQGTPQPGTGSLEGQTSDPNNAQNGVQTAQDGQDNGLGGSQTNPGLQSPQQPVSEGQNSPNTLPSAAGEGENKTGGSAKEQQDSIQEGSRGQGSLQPEAKNPTNPDSDANSHGVKTDDRSQKVDSGLQAGQPGVQTDQGGGDEHRSDSASEIPAPGPSNNPVQGADNVDTNPQLSGETATTTPTSGEEQKASVVNTGVTGSQQSTTTIQTASPGAPVGTDDGNNGGSSLPNVGATPGAADTQNLGTGDNGASGSEPSNELGNGTTGGSSGSSDSSTTDPSSQSKEEKINAKLGTLNIPSGCNFSSGSTSTTCSVNKDELNKMKFNDGDNSVSGSVDNNVENLQLKIEILTGSKKTAYGLNGESEEEGDVTKDILFTFSGFNDEINLDSDDAFKIYPKTNPEFKIEGDELVKVWDQAVNLAKKIGFEKGQDSTNYSLKTGTTTLKYSLDSGTTINTLNSPTTSGTIDVEPDKENYNQGVKVTFRGKVTGTGADSLDANTCYEIKYKDGDNEGWYLSLVKPKVTQPTTGES